MSWAETSPPIDYFVFNYAVYANYHAPTGTPPYDLEDFPIETANSAEAFCASVNELESNLYWDGDEGGGSISMDVEVFDWQGDYGDVAIEAPGVIPLTSASLVGPGSTPKSQVFTFLDVPGVPTHTGDLDIIVTAYDSKTFGEAWFQGLLPQNHPLYNWHLYDCFVHTTQVATTPCENMDPISVYDAFVKQNDPWKYLSPQDAGLACTRSDATDKFIVSSVVNYYPVTFETFGASRVDSANPIVPDVTYSSGYWLAGGIACTADNKIYFGKRSFDSEHAHTLASTTFDGLSFTTPKDEYTFMDYIVRIVLDDNDNPVVLLSNEPGTLWKVEHWFDGNWHIYPVNSTIIDAGIKDFAYNPAQGHYMFACENVAIRLFAQDNAGNIVWQDDEVFGTQPISWIPAIYIDQDNPHCHIVVWATMDSGTSFARPIVRYAAKDYSVKIQSNLTVSGNGASVPGGVWAPGTDYMFIPAYDTDYNQALGRITLPEDW
jgi:hypothetical protein